MAKIQEHIYIIHGKHLENRMFSLQNSTKKDPEVSARQHIRREVNVTKPPFMVKRFVYGLSENRRVIWGISIHQNGCFTRENPINMDDLGVAPFMEAPISPYSTPQNPGVHHHSLRNHARHVGVQAYTSNTAIGELPSLWLRALIRSFHLGAVQNVENNSAVSWGKNMHSDPLINRTMCSACYLCMNHTRDTEKNMQCKPPVCNWLNPQTPQTSH